MSPRLVCDGRDVAPVDLATSGRARMRGLLGRDGLEGALLLAPAFSVHTLGVRFAIDVAFCDGDLHVLRTVTMKPHRLGRPVLRSRAVIEAEAGRFAPWGLEVGSALAVVDEHGHPVAW